MKTNKKNKSKAKRQKAQPSKIAPAFVQAPASDIRENDAVTIEEAAHVEVESQSAAVELNPFLEERDSVVAEPPAVRKEGWFARNFGA